MHLWWVLPAAALLITAVAALCTVHRIEREVRELERALLVLREASDRRRDLSHETERARRRARQVSASLGHIAAR